MLSGIEWRGCAAIVRGGRLLKTARKYATKAHDAIAGNDHKPRFANPQESGKTRRASCKARQHLAIPYCPHRTRRVRHSRKAACRQMRMMQPTIRAASLAAARVQERTPLAHYQTPEHRAWRMHVLKRAGFKCENCGAQFRTLYADHIHEIKDGGSLLDPANGQCLCGQCHNTKTIRERKARLAKRP